MREGQALHTVRWNYYLLVFAFHGWRALVGARESGPLESLGYSYAPGYNTRIVI